MKAEQLQDWGYVVIPTPKGARGPQGEVGWNKDDYEPGPIDADYGIRLDDVLCVDIDVDDQELVAGILGILDPDELAPMRYRPNSSRVALFFQAGDWDYINGAKYRAGQVQYRVGRHFQKLCGTHHSGVEFLWDTPMTPKDRLPVLSGTKFAEVEMFLTERSEKITDAIMGSTGKAQPALHWDSVVTIDGERTTVRDLWPEILRNGPDNGLKCNPTFLREDADSNNGLLFSWDDKPFLHDFKEGTSYFLADEDLLTDETACMDAEGEVERVAPEEHLMAEESVNDMLYCRSEEKIYSKTMPGKKPQSPRGAFAGRGKPVEMVEELVDCGDWFDQPTWDARLPPLSVQETPDGRVFNVFNLPKHPKEGGSTVGFHRFLDHLIPNEQERSIFLDWLAVKTQNPGRRYFAVVLYGAQGSGKGLMADIIRHLFGERVVKTATLKSIYKGWANVLYRSLYGIVEETSDLTSRRGEREANYEQLKQMVDPAAKEMELDVKSTGMPIHRVCTTFLFCTNRPDALPLQEDTRRFCVMETGPALPEPEIERITRWWGDPENVGALWRELRSRTPAHNGFNAPDTPSKTKMVLAGLSDVDEAVDNFCERVRSLGGAFAVVTAKQFAVDAGLEPKEVKAFLSLVRRRKAYRMTAKSQVKIGGNFSSLNVLEGGIFGSEEHARVVARAVHEHICTLVV